MDLMRLIHAHLITEARKDDVMLQQQSMLQSRQNLTSVAVLHVAGPLSDIFK